MIRNIKFETFADAVLKVGGTNPRQIPQFVTDINGIQCELKRTSMIIGYCATQEARDQIVEALTDLGFNLSGSQPRGLVRVEYSTDDDLAEFCEVLSAIDSLEFQMASNGRAVKVFEKSFSVKAIAKRYFFAIENEDQIMLDLARRLLSADDYDNDISLNDKSETNDYREHIVPCVMIHNRIIEMIMVDNASLIEVSNFIKNNLMIVYIPTAVANHIDYDLGLQTSMPQGWEWGDSVFARLEAAGHSF